MSGDQSTRAEVRTSDLALAVAVTLVICLVVATDRSGLSPVEGIVCAFVFGALLLMRRRAPVVVLAVSTVLVVGYVLAGFSHIGMVLPAVGALYSAAELDRTPWAVGSAAVLIALAAVVHVDGFEPRLVVSGYTFITELALAAAAIALGVVVRLGREARERTARIAELTAAEEVHAVEARMQEERMRVARDVHDTIGHTLSVASLHAAVALEAKEMPAARAALAEVRDATSEALQELRRTVKVLRAEPSTTAEPALGLASVDRVFDAARSAGLRLDTRITVPAGGLSRID